MSCVASFATSSGPKAIAGPSRRAPYRRSTTTKAPRKRTFLMSMEKCSAMQSSVGSGVALNTVSALRVAATYDVCHGGNDGPRNGNGGMGGNGGNNNDNNGGFSSGNNGNQGGAPSLAAVALGAMVLSFGLISPLPTVATETSRPSANERSGKLPTSVRLPGATLVIPNSSTSLARRSAPTCIPYGICDISKDERRGLVRTNDQFNAREAVRVQ